MNILILLIWLVLMTGVLCLAFQVIKAHQSNPRQSKPRRVARTDFQIAQRSARVMRTDLDNVSCSPEWNKLLRLVHSSATAERLVADYKNRNPSRSLKWCIEKAVWDVERDRRY